MTTTQVPVPPPPTNPLRELQRMVEAIKRLYG